MGLLLLFLFQNWINLYIWKWYWHSFIISILYFIIVITLNETQLSEWKLFWYVIYSFRSVGTPDAAVNLRDPVCLTCDEGEGCGYADATFSRTTDYYILSCLGPDVPYFHLRWTNDQTKSKSYHINLLINGHRSDNGVHVYTSNIYLSLSSIL